MSLSEYWKLQQCKIKLGLVVLVQPSPEPPDVDIKLVDGAAFVNMNLPGCSKTYEEYCDAEPTEGISNIAETLIG